MRGYTLTPTAPSTPESASMWMAEEDTRRRFLALKEAVPAASNLG